MIKVVDAVNRLILWGLLLSFVLPAQAHGGNRHPFSDVNDIARAIYFIRPQLPESRIVRYAKAILAASKSFGVEPFTLVAIAHQESTFRENLPEGKAGEIGMLQIRKSWLQNPQFRRTFKSAKIRDLYQPEKSFLYAAWILRDLRKSGKKTSLPYWTFYNARNFHHRFKYYLRVKRHLSSIESKMQQPELDSLKVVGEWQPEVRIQDRQSLQVFDSRQFIQDILSKIDWGQKAAEALREVPAVYID